MLVSQETNKFWSQTIQTYNHNPQVVATDCMKGLNKYQKLNPLTLRFIVWSNKRHPNGLRVECYSCKTIKNRFISFEMSVFFGTYTHHLSEVVRKTPCNKEELLISFMCSIIQNQ